MQIIFDRVLPTPLANFAHAANSIWNSHQTIQTTQHSLLNASSGKGKTTFTHLLCGLRQDYTGKVLFDEQPLSQFSKANWTSIRKEKISFVFQDLQLFSDLSVAENLRIKNALTDTFTDQQMRDMLEFLGIGSKWNDPCRTLSMGQQQRVAIIRALCQPFEWILLDEPFSHLDEENTALCLQLIRERCQTLGAGSLITTLGDFHKLHYDHILNL